MRILINISDVRKYRQLSKQVNSDSFSGHARTIQQNQLSELLGIELFTDFINFLDSGFTNYAGTFTIDSATKITVSGADVSSWVNYSLRLNNDTFVVVDSAVFGGVDTVLTVSGYDLPTNVTTLDFSTENKYTKLLNGETYTNSNGNFVLFYGLRPYLCWHFLSAYLVDGSMKQSDLGNINILGENFTGASSFQLKESKSEYLQNTIRQSNFIKEYLNQKESDFQLWKSTTKENIVNYDFFIV